MVTPNEDPFNGSDCHANSDIDACKTHILHRLEWHKIVFLILFLTVFVCGVLGNSLVCLVIWKNKHMRTVTNVFILNLAIADLLVLFLVVIPTMLQDIFGAWYFGDAGCKIIFFLQRVSVIVSILTLTTISVERYNAICHPLNLNTTPTRVILLIVFIWLLAMAFSIPELLYSGSSSSSVCGQDDLNFIHVYFYIYIIAFYILPFLIMTAAYIKIARSLWTSHVEEFSATGCRSRSGSQGVVSQLIQRRRAARMLIAVVVCFFLCYLTHNVTIIIILHTDYFSWDPRWVLSLITIGHLLIYVNSAANPIIYNFLSEKFRVGFSNICGCCTSCKKTPTEHTHLSSWHNRSDRTYREDTKATDI